MALAAIDGLIIGTWVATFFVDLWLGIGLALPALAIAFVPDVIAYIAIHLRYDTTWYVVTDRSLPIRRGIWVITDMTITFENVQNVRVDQGPVQRYFGIADVTIDTAGAGAASDHHGRRSVSNEAVIEGVANAAFIRDLVLGHVRRSKTAGLGDEAGRSPVASGWRPEHVDLLREIAAALRAIQPPHAATHD